MAMMSTSLNSMFPNANSASELDGLNEIFDVEAASSGEAFYSNWAAPNSMLWAKGDSDLQPDLPNHVLGHEDIGGSDPSSPFGQSPFSFTSSLESTPSAIFSSSSTNFLSLPDDPFGDLVFEYDDSNSLGFLDANNKSPNPLPDSFEYDSYGPLPYLDENYNYTHPLPNTLGHNQTDTPSHQALLPTFRLQYFPNEHDSTILDLDDASHSGTISSGVHRAVSPGRAPEDIDLYYSTTQATAIPSADDFRQLNPGIRRSTRNFTSPRKESLYYDPDPPDDPPPQSSASAKRVKRKVDDDEYDNEVDEDRAAQLQRKSRPVRRRKPETIRCKIPGCSQTFGRENDMKRHLLCAAVHKADRPFILDSLQMALSPSQCEYCGENLSRRDARLRHERDQSCGKRTGRKKARMVSSTS